MVNHTSTLPNGNINEMDRFKGLLDSAISSPSDTTVGAVISWLVDGGLDDAISANSYSPGEFEGLTQLLVTGPDRLANACAEAGTSIDSLVSPQLFCSLAVRSIVSKLLSEAYNAAQRHDDPCVGVTIAGLLGPAYCDALAALLGRLGTRLARSNAEYGRHVAACLMASAASFLLSNHDGSDGSGRSGDRLLTPSAELHPSTLGSCTSESWQKKHAAFSSLARFLLLPGRCFASVEAQRRAVEGFLAAAAQIARFSALDGALAAYAFTGTGAPELSSKENASTLSARLSRLLAVLLGPPASLPRPLLAFLGADVWTLAPWPSDVVNGLLGYLLSGLPRKRVEHASQTSSGDGGDADSGASESKGKQECIGVLEEGAYGEMLERLPLNRIAALWAQPTFATSVDPPIQASLTRALVSALALCPDRAFDVSSSDLMLTLMGGVQARMDSPHGEVRGMGLRVAEAYGGRALRRAQAVSEVAQERAEARKAADHTANPDSTAAAGGDDDREDGELQAELEAAAREAEVREAAEADRREAGGFGGSDDAGPLKFDSELTIDGYDVRLSEISAPIAPLLEGLAGDPGSMALLLAQPDAHWESALVASSESPESVPSGDATHSMPLEAQAKQLTRIDPANMVIDVAAFARSGSTADAFRVATEASAGEPSAAKRVTVRVHGPGVSPLALKAGPASLPTAPTNESPAAVAARKLAAKAPTSLTDMVPALREESDFERCLAALATLPRMARAAATTLSAQASLLREGPLLLRVLATLDDRFALPEFPMWRHTGLVSLAVALGPLAVHALHRAFWGPEMADGVRLELLDVLVGAARELSGQEEAVVPVPPWEMEREGAAKAQGAPSPPPPSASRAKAAAPANLFGDVCLDWYFSPLLRGVLTGSPHKSKLRAHGAVGLGLTPQQRDGGGGGGDTDDSAMPADIAASLRGGGVKLHTGPGRLVDDGPGGSPSRPMLLAQCLRVLALFVEAAGADPSVPGMARSLLSLSWTLKAHSDAGVRRAVLACFASVIAAFHRHGGPEQLVQPSVLVSLGQQYAPSTAGLSATAPAALAPAPRIATLPLDVKPKSRGPLVMEVGSDESGDARGFASSDTGNPGAGGSDGGGTGTALNDLMRVSARVCAHDATAAIMAQLGDSRSASATGPQGASASKANAMLAAASSALLSSSASHGLSEHEAAVASAIVGAPLVWDDVVAVAGHLRAVADSEPDDVCRALANTMLRNAVLRHMVLGPEVP